MQISVVANPSPILAAAVAGAPVAVPADRYQPTPAAPRLLSRPAVQSPLRAHVQAVVRSLDSGALPANGYVYGERTGQGSLAVRGIQQAPAFTMRLTKPQAEDAAVAAGVALAAGRPSIYLVADRKELPWFLQEADQTYPGQVAILSGDDLKSASLDLHAASSTTPPPPVKTFIGCLMSGLTPEQYKEGREHLQAIDAALGSEGNYCEGIRVTSTSTFDTPRDSLRADMDAIRGSERCVFYLYDGQPRPSGMWVEAGAAIGLGKPCTFLVPTRDALPPCLQGSSLPPGVRIVEFADHATLLRDLAALLGA